MVAKVPMGHAGTQNWAQGPGGGGGRAGTWLVERMLAWSILVPLTSVKSVAGIIFNFWTPFGLVRF